MKQNLQREKAIQHLLSLGIPREDIAPPLLRGLWRLGFDMPPPVFASFWQNFFVSGVFYSAMSSGPIWAVYWSRNGTSPLQGILCAVGAGAVFGLISATSSEKAKRKNGLPAWRDLGRATEC